MQLQILQIYIYGQVWPVADRFWEPTNGTVMMKSIGIFTLHLVWEPGGHQLPAPVVAQNILLVVQFQEIKATVGLSTQLQ